MDANTSPLRVDTDPTLDVWDWLDAADEKRIRVRLRCGCPGGSLTGAGWLLRGCERHAVGTPDPATCPETVHAKIPTARTAPTWRP